MDGGGTHRTPEDVFRDFRARRAGMIKALTTDVEKFYQQCDPEKENLCLYGLPNETWEVNLPAEEVPPELPEPALGINFARDGMDEKDWLSLVAVHSDAWLLAVAFYFGARFGFDKESRSFLSRSTSTWTQRSRHCWRGRVHIWSGCWEDIIKTRLYPYALCSKAYMGHASVKLFFFALFTPVVLL
ncbi:unnamed protein product [Triticum turgidum subsp. durum]|uniref:PHD finger protein ALFIN-LIKE n=1 Tax=Triticum turgidum subsp. durum TaxID=4567 RepID=A0A9R0SXU0_TRITD|nr:unnamed protein product [Triticum turgidum subsp. durum]